MTGNVQLNSQQQEKSLSARLVLCVFTSSSVAGHIPEFLVGAPPAERDALLLHAVPVKVFLLPVLPSLAWVCSWVHCGPHAAGEQCCVKLAARLMWRLRARIRTNTQLVFTVALQILNTVFKSAAHACFPSEDGEKILWFNHQCLQNRRDFLPLRANTDGCSCYT